MATQEKVAELVLMGDEKEDSDKDPRKDTYDNFNQNDVAKHERYKNSASKDTFDKNYCYTCQSHFLVLDNDGSSNVKYLSYLLLLN